jgi:CelD/BcsL family acetyltransferase involved in cellulose biosynthesis
MSSDILVADPQHAESAATAFNRYLTKRARNSWDILDLPYISEESYSLDSLLRLFRSRALNLESMETFTLDLPETFTDFRERLPQKLVKDLKRRQSRMTEEIEACKFRIADSLSKSDRERVAELHRIRQLTLRDRGARRHSIFEIEDERKAFWSMVDFAESNHQARFYLLEADDKIVAFFICFEFGKTLHHYLMALDDAYSKYAPSKLLMLFLAEAEIEKFNTKVVNLSTGINTFKQEFCNRHTRHWHLTIENSGLNAKLRLAVYHGLIRLKRFINGESAE